MIDTIDFAKMYVEYKKVSTFRNKKASDWDEKAEYMSKRVRSPYTFEFTSKMNLKDFETFLDVGCGPGTIAIALAPKLKKVCGLDFSIRMLESFLQNAKERNIESVQTIHRSWEDGWSDIEPYDIVVASRSMEVEDLKDGLTKLNSKAKKAVYLTYKVGGSFVDEEILRFIGKDIVTRPDYIYVLLILREMGIYAKLDFIDTSDSFISYESKEAFVSSLEWSLDGLKESQKTKAKEFYDKYISTGTFKPKGFKWAFIYWEK